MKRKLSQRMTRGVVFGIIGVLVLSLSVVAAYGSASGYGKYKDAVTGLITDTDNATFRLQTAVTLDGTTKSTTGVVFRLDGKNFSRHEKNSYDDGVFSELYSSTVDGVTQHFFAEDDYFYVYEDESSGSFFGGFGGGDVDAKIVKFASLLADTVLGDLKNNVVLVSEKDGLKKYALDVKAEQVPPLVNAAIDLIGAQENYGGYTVYDDEDATLKAFYEKTYGEPLPENVAKILAQMKEEAVHGVASGPDLEVADEDSDAWEAYWKIYDEMEAAYMEILKKEGEDDRAVLCVHADGSYTLYDDYAAYAIEEEVGSDVTTYFSSNTLLNNVSFHVTLDENDRIVANDCTVTFDTTDAKGELHHLEFSLKLKVSDYGTTEVRHFNTGDRKSEAEITGGAVSGSDLVVTDAEAAGEDGDDAEADAIPAEATTE